MAKYSDRPGGPIWRACRLRMIEGLPDREIAERLRAELPEECAGIVPETVMAWRRSGAISWDGIAELVGEVRAEAIAKAPGIDPRYADELVTLVKLKQRCEKTLLGTGPEDVTPFDDEWLTEHRIRLDTYHAKLLAEIRERTSGDLARIPRPAIRKIIAIALREIVTAMVELGLVSAASVQGKAAAIVDAIEKKIPHLIRQAQTEETLSDGE
jgi:hypothetical protein